MMSSNGIIEYSFNASDEDYLDVKLQDIDNFLSRLKTINPADLSNRIKSRFHNVYVKCGFVSSFWEINDKKCNPSKSKIDDLLWRGNFLLKYLYEQYIKYTLNDLTGKRYLFCCICKISFEVKSEYLIDHLNDLKHASMYTKFNSEIQDGLWKGYLTYRNAFENFIELRSETFYCKICGIICPLTHNNLIQHLDGTEHATNFRGILSYELNCSSFTSDARNIEKLISEEKVGDEGTESNSYLNWSNCVFDSGEKCGSGNSESNSCIKWSDENFGLEETPQVCNELSSNLTSSKNHISFKKCMRRENKLRRKDPSSKHDQFMEETRQKYDGFKYFCESCNHFEINSSIDSVIKHIYSEEHSLINFDSVDDFRWWYCEFCCASLFCTLNVFSFHYRHPLHINYVTLYIKKNLRGSVQEKFSNSEVLDCKWIPKKQGNYSELNLTKKYVNDIKIIKMSKNLIRKSAKKKSRGEFQGFLCYICDYMCQTPSKWASHLVSDQHEEKISPDYKLFKCECYCEHFFTDDMYIEHLSSVSHLNLISFFRNDFQNIELKNRVRFSLTNKASPININDIIVFNWFECDKNSIKDFNFKLNFLNFSVNHTSHDSYESVHKSDENVNLKTSSRESLSDPLKFSDAQSRGENESNLDDTSSCRNKKKSGFGKFLCNNVNQKELCVTQTENRSLVSARIKHNELMEKIEYCESNSKLYCQECCYFEKNSSKNSLLQHNHTGGNPDKNRWWHCDFCSVDLFCTREIIKCHYEHPVHVKFIEKYIAKNINVSVENELSKPKFSIDTMNKSVKRVNETLQELIRNMFSIMIKSPENGANGFFCYSCLYIACKWKKWNKHVLSFSHVDKTRYVLTKKNFYCKCGILFSCSDEIYAEHLSSVDHFNLLSFLEQCFCNRKIEESQKTLASQASINLDHINQHQDTSCDVPSFRLNQLNSVKDELEDYYNNSLNIASSFQKEQLKLETKQNSFQLNEKQSSDALKGNHKSSKLESKENLDNTDLEDFQDDSNILPGLKPEFNQTGEECTLRDQFELETCIENNFRDKKKEIKIMSKQRKAADLNKHNEFMNKICEQTDCFKYFCQICGFYEMNTSSDAMKNHESSPEHKNNATVLPDIFKWRNCRFCSAGILCSSDLFSSHFRNLIHVKFVSEYVSNVTGNYDGNCSESQKCSSNLTLKKANNRTTDSLLNNLLRVLFRKVVKQCNSQVYGYFCCSCNYTSCRFSGWNSHLSSKFHTGNVHRSENYKIIYCDCHIVFFCSNDFYSDHVSSVKHLNLTTFFSQFSRTPLNRSFRQHFPVDSKGLSGLKQVDKQIDEESAIKDQHEFKIENRGLDKSKKIKKKTKLSKADLSKHNEFMNKSCEQPQSFKYFCQICGWYEINISSNALTNHVVSPDHIQIGSGILPNNLRWRYCRFCSAAILCSSEFFSFHFQHSIHLKFLKEYVSNATDINDGKDSKTCECNRGTSNQTLKNTVKLLTNVISTVFSKIGKRRNQQTRGYLCCACGYGTCKCSKWNSHISVHNYERNVCCSENYKIVDCDCGVIFFCNNDFYTEHISSANHLNLKTFFEEEFGNPALESDLGLSTDLQV